jgi:ankyrin repeat protein
MGPGALPALVRATESKEQQLRELAQELAVQIVANAIDDNEKHVVELFLAQGGSVNIRDPRGNSLLHHTIRDSAQPEMVKLLLNRGADPNAQNEDGDTPLHMAAHSALIEHGLEKPDIEDIEPEVLPDGGVLTPLVAPWDSNEILKPLLDHGADINARNGDGLTPLAEALIHRQVKLARWLIANGADMDSGILIEAACYGKTEIVKLLLANGANVKHRNKEGLCAGQTPLLVAAGAGHREIVELLLAHGADVNARIEDGSKPRGSTALHLAVIGGNEGIVQILLASGADVNARRADELTPLGCAHVALQKHAQRKAKKEKYEKIAEQLRQHGATE